MRSAGCATRSPRAKRPSEATGVVTSDDRAMIGAGSLHGSYLRCYRSWSLFSSLLVWLLASLSPLSPSSDEVPSSGAVVSGMVSELPIHWNYYHISDETGRQAAIVCCAPLTHTIVARNRGPALVEPLLQRVCDRPHVIVEPAEGEQGAGQ